MNEVNVLKQIEQMVRFIRQEAEEKANEISVSAEEEFNIVKLQLVEAVNKWFDQSHTKRKIEDGPMAVFAPAPAPAHNNNTFTFSATSSSTSAAPTPKTGIPDFTCAMKKFKPSPPSRRSATYAMKKFKSSPPSRRSATSSTSTAPKAGIHDFDDKFNKMMEQFTPSSGTFSFSAPPASAPAYEGFFKVNTNISTLKATADDDKILRRRIYNDIDSVCQRPEFVVPPHIKEFCDLALEKYNNENGTIYRYVCPTLAYEDEDAKAHETTHHFIFKASASDNYYDSETFEALIKSGFRFSEGITSYVKEIPKVSRLPENV